MLVIAVLRRVRAVLCVLELLLMLVRVQLLVVWVQLLTLAQGRLMEVATLVRYAWVHDLCVRHAV